MEQTKLSIIAVLLLSPTSFAQEATVANASREFNKAWLSRNAKAVNAHCANGATLFGTNGGDQATVSRAIWQQNRSLRNATSTEAVAHREVRVTGDTAVVTRVSRVDHKTKNNAFSIPQRQTEFWSQVDGTWKLTHLHQSPYMNFATAITTFDAADRKQMPKPGGVVFVGSSSIRMWKSLNEDFPDTNNVHRGFGGSQLIDSIMYCDRLITRYAPTKVVVYAGDNDVAAGKKADRVLQDFKTLVASIHAKVPEAKIGFIAIKPSRARWNLWPEMDKANKLVARFASKNSKLEYFDIATPMLSENGGQPDADWFVADGLHMTPKGYELWTKVIRPWVDAK